MECSVRCGHAVVQIPVLFRSAVQPTAVSRTLAFITCRPRRPDTPLVMIASPYCVYPPAHGGARRMHEFDRAAFARFRHHSTERRSRKLLGCELQIFPEVSSSESDERQTRRRDPHGRIDRILTHSHSVLAAQLRALILMYDPEHRSNPNMSNWRSSSR